MPPPNDLQNCISATLKKSLAETRKKSDGDGKVSQTVMSSAKRALLEKATIKFVKAEQDANSMLQNLKDKYICLHQTSPVEKLNGQTKPETKVGVSESDGLPRPKLVLYPPDKVNLLWKSPRKVGAGLSNLGNTCFLNSVLQCLTYTAPLANHLLNNQHKPLCRSKGFCMLCELHGHVNKCLTQCGGAMKPLGVLQKLKLIAKHMRWGRQEDAHEFLRYLVDAMQKSCLAGQSTSLEKLSKETTLMHQVFGGYLRSQVRCLQCKTTSNTYDPMLDLSIDLKGVNSLDKALQRFVQPETLDVDNAYKCPRCRKKVRALKQFTIHRPPKVLTVHLKRFDYHRLMGGKVSRHIDFSNSLNIRPYMSSKQGPPVTYQLYAVLVHSGYSCNSGHYYCYVKAANQTWYCMNDSHVSQTGLNSVLSSEAYILFYSLTSPAGQGHMSSVSNGVKKKVNGVKSATQLVNGTSTASATNQKIPVTPLAASGTSQKVAATPLAASGTSQKVTATPLAASGTSQKVATTPLAASGTIQKIAVTPLAASGTNQKVAVTPLVASGTSQKVAATPLATSPKLTNSPAIITNGPSKSKLAVKKKDTLLVRPSVISNGPTSQSASTAAAPKDSLISVSSTRLSSPNVKVNSKRAGQSSKEETLRKENKRGVDREKAEDAAPPTKIMSPPPSRPEMCRTFSWQVEATNGRLHSQSESDTGSINSTSSWTVTSIPASEDTTASPAKHKHSGKRKADSESAVSAEVKVKKGLQELNESSPPATRQSAVSEKKSKKRKRSKSRDGTDIEAGKRKKVQPAVSSHLTLNQSNGMTDAVGSRESNGMTDAAGSRESNGTADIAGSEKSAPGLQTSSGKQKRRFSEPSVKVWDATTDENEAALRRQSTSCVRSVWDGRKDSNVGLLIEKHAANVSGLGSGVYSWDGGKSEVNREVEKEKLMSGLNNGWYDGYEQDIDEGRRKKVKVKKNKGTGNRDHFQGIQNSTNTVRQLKREGKLNSLPSYIY